MIIGYDDMGNPIDDGSGDGSSTYGSNYGDPGYNTSNPGYGMNDRGLGTSDPTLSNGDGTLSPSVIAQLTQLAQQPGGSGLSQWAQQMLKSVGGLSGSPLSNGLSGLFSGNGLMGLGSLIGGIKMFQDSKDYRSWADQAKNTADPFNGQRQYYQDQMNMLEKDPSSIANTPGYQFALQQGLGAVNRGDMASKGTVPHSDDIAFASGLAQQTYNARIAQLMQASGANNNNGPAAAANLQLGAMQNSQQASSAALNALGTGARFLTGNGGGTPTNTNSGSPSTVGDLIKTVNGG